jgi:hypothetical protein
MTFHVTVIVCAHSEALFLPAACTRLLAHTSPSQILVFAPQGRISR